MKPSQHAYWSRVDEQCNKQGDNDDDESTNNVPLPVLPNNVFERLPRTGEPEERRLWTTIEKGQNKQENTAGDGQPF